MAVEPWAKKNCILQVTLSKFSAPVQTDAAAHPAYYTMGTGSFPGVKRSGRGVDHPPHPAPRLKKQYSYTSTPPPPLPGAFVDCSKVKFTLSKVEVVYTLFQNYMLTGLTAHSVRWSMLRKVF
jgi:hypothetical protein